MHEARRAAHLESVYLFFSFSISWIIWLPFIFSADGLHLFHYTLDPSWIALGTIGPVAASLGVSKRYTGRWFPSRFFPILRPVPLLNILTAPLLLLASIDLIPYFLCTVSGSRHPQWSDFASLLLLWPGVLGGPLGEEFGWRGFLLPRLMVRLGRVRGTLLLSLIWTAWHLPLFLVHTWSSAPLWFFCILLVGTSFLMTLGYNLTGGSILAAILAHFTFNCSAEIFGNLLSGAQTRPGVNPFYVMPAVLSATAILAVLLTRKRLGFLPAISSAASGASAGVALE